MEDYITRGQLLPGPVLRTVTHSGDIKSLTDSKTEKGHVFPRVPQREIPHNAFHLVSIQLAPRAASWVRLSKLQLLKTHALSGCEVSSGGLSLNTDRFLMERAIQRETASEAAADLSGVQGGNLDLSESIQERFHRAVRTRALRMASQ